MKKVISLLLVLVLALSLVACGSKEGAKKPVEKEAGPAFSVGYGKAIITPDGNVPMGGYGRSENRISTGRLSELYATCIAISDADGNTILLYGLDLCNSAEAAKYAVDVSKATGVPVENIVMSASHTHSAPDLSITSNPEIPRALQKIKNGLVDAAVTAMEDRKPAKMFKASVITSGLNFVRHYVAKDPAGTYVGDNFNDAIGAQYGYAGHATEADPEMQLVKFTREGDNDIILTNFQTHPHRTGGSAKYELSADIVGEYRIAMEEDLGCEVIYFSGAGGNINPTSRIAEENVTKDFREQGKALARYAKKAEYEPVATGKVQASAYRFEADINHADDANASICRQLRTQWDEGEITTAELIEIGKTYGLELHSPYHAGAISSRAGMNRSSSFDIWAYSFGDVGFVAAPYEMFDTNGVYIKTESPFDMTIIATISNLTNGYFPSDQTFDYGSYEVDTTKYVRGTAEKLADQYLTMLNELYTNK